jgi:hypothetical protein
MQGIPLVRFAIIVNRNPGVPIDNDADLNFGHVIDLLGKIAGEGDK